MKRLFLAAFVLIAVLIVISVINNPVAGQGESPGQYVIDVNPSSGTVISHGELPPSQPPLNLTVNIINQTGQTPNQVKNNSNNSDEDYSDDDSLLLGKTNVDPDSDNTEKAIFDSLERVGSSENYETDTDSIVGYDCDENGNNCTPILNSRFTNNGNSSPERLETNPNNSESAIPQRLGSSTYEWSIDYIAGVDDHPVASRQEISGNNDVIKFTVFIMWHPQVSCQFEENVKSLQNPANFICELFKEPRENVNRTPVQTLTASSMPNIKKIKNPRNEWTGQVWEGYIGFKITNITFSMPKGTLGSSLRSARLTVKAPGGPYRFKPSKLSLPDETAKR